MAAMVAPCADSVQNALDLLPASRRELRRGDAAASAKSPVVFLKARRLRAASRWRAALLRCRRRPPTHSQPHGPRKTARTKGQTCAGSRHDSETLSWPAGRRGARRGRVRAHAPRSPRRRSSKNRTHAQHTPATQNPDETADRRPASLQRDQSRVSEDDDDIHVIKRNGKKEVVRYDKITSRIKKLCYGLDSKYIKPNVPRQRLFRTFPNFKLRRLRRRDATSS